MARGRILKPDFFSDRRMTKLSPLARLFYQGMWCFALCDRGHLPDDAEELKLKILPADDVDPEELLNELLDQTRVLRKRLPDGQTYLHAWKLPNHAKTDSRWASRCLYCAAEIQKRSSAAGETPESTSQPAEAPSPTGNLAQPAPSTPDLSGASPTTPDHTPPQPPSPHLTEPRASFGEAHRDSLSLAETHPTSPAIGVDRNREEGSGESVVALREQPQTARARELEEPPPNSGPPGRAEQIVAAWKESLRRPPLGRIVSQVGVIVQAALAEGQDPVDVVEGLRLWQANGRLGVGSLPSFIHQAANGPRPGTALAVVGSQRPARSTTDERVAGWLALGSGSAA